MNNSHIAREITQACGWNPSDLIVEIGPGRGFLTGFLAEKYPGRLLAIEIDPKMLRYLRHKFPDDKIVRVLEADFLNVDLSAVLPSRTSSTEATQAGGKSVHFVGNLPYAVASPILQKILGWRHFTSAVLMFQKEVADRITASAGSTRYGVLTLSVRVRADVSLVADVGKSSFKPEPKVDSAVLYFKKKEAPVLGGKEEEKNFFRVVRGAFAHRRKTVLNSLSNSMNLEKDETKRWLESAGIDPKLRAEAISLESYLQLASMKTSGHSSAGGVSLH